MRIVTLPSFSRFFGSSSSLWGALVTSQTGQSSLGVYNVLLKCISFFIYIFFFCRDSPAVSLYIFIYLLPPFFALLSISPAVRPLLGILYKQIPSPSDAHRADSSPLFGAYTHFAIASPLISRLAVHSLSLICAIFQGTHVAIFL